MPVRRPGPLGRLRRARTLRGLAGPSGLVATAVAAMLLAGSASADAASGITRWCSLNQHEMTIAAMPPGGTEPETVARVALVIRYCPKSGGGFRGSQATCAYEATPRPGVRTRKVRVPSTQPSRNVREAGCAVRAAVDRPDGTHPKCTARFHVRFHSSGDRAPKLRHVTGACERIGFRIRFRRLN